MKRIMGLALAAALAASCGSGPGKVVQVSLEEDQVKLTFAESLVRQGHYLAFKKAAGIYGGLYARPAQRPRVAGPYAESLLLLALREKALGIDRPATAGLAERTIQENPQISGLAPYATLIAAMPPRTKGVIRDIDTGSLERARRDRIRAAEDEVRRRAAGNAFAAYVLAAWSCSFGRYSEGWRDPAELLKAFPGSLLMKYEVSICGEAKPGLLEELLKAEPGFAEVHYHLGEAALAERKLFTAEGHLLKAFEAVPESPQVRILLAGIYFATEEFDKSLQFYDLTLEVSPEYRDALLGKAICLSYLGRREEAMKVLDRILQLGYWLLGESHYWLAWNLHELKNDPEALRHADEAKGRLPTNGHVFSLAGTVGLDIGDLERAEKDFREALKYEPSDTESLFGLGTLFSQKLRWTEAGEFYEKAGAAHDADAASLQGMLEDLRLSPLPEERRTRLLRRREAQLEKVRLAGATSFYNAATAFLNAGSRDKARKSVEAALRHPALKEKAEELLRAIDK